MRWSWSPAPTEPGRRRSCTCSQGSCRWQRARGPSWVTACRRLGTGYVVGSPLVGHESFCYDDLTVWDNLLFHARLAGLRRSDAEGGLARLGLQTIADRRHGRLSAGQRRRCALAVAMIRDSELLLLDEPHAALDRDGRELVDQLIADAAARGTTVVVVSHEPDRIRPFSQRELVMDDGRLRPASSTVASEK